MANGRLKTRRPSVTPVAQVIDVLDMTGGVDLRSSPTQIGPTRARTLVNYQLGESGALLVRPGYRQFSSLSLGTGRIQGAERVYLSSQTFTLAAWSGSIYRPTDAGAWGAAVGSTVLSTAQVFFPHDRDYVAAFDGSTNIIRKSTNGSSWVRFGIAPSSTNSTLSTASSGDLLANEYEIGFTFRNDSAAFDPPHESNGGAVSTITLGATGAIRVEVTGSTDPQVGVVRFYARNKTAGETVRRFSTFTSNVSGTTLSVTITSSNWSGALPEPTDNTVPPPLVIGAPWKNRWWARHATVGNRLHFTQVFQAQSWPATFFLDIPFERGDEIRALVPMGDTLLIFGNSGVFLVIGQTSLDFEVRPALDSQDGALGPRAVAAIENGVLHAGESGIYIFDGASDRLLSFDIHPAWRDVIELGAQADLIRIPCVYHALRQEVRVAVPRRYPGTAAGEWVLDLNRTAQQKAEAWAATDRRVGGYLHWNGAEQTIGFRGRLQSWNDTSGLINDESTGQTANSSNMRAEYEGPTLALGLHRARVIDLRGEYEPHGGTFQVETVIDGQSQGQRTINIGAGLDVYGTAVYGTGTYAGAGRRMFHRQLPAGAEGRTILLKTVYTGQEAFRHFTYAYQIVPEPMSLGFSE